MHLPVRWGVVLPPGVVSSLLTSAFLLLPFSYDAPSWRQAQPFANVSELSLKELV